MALFHLCSVLALSSLRRHDELDIVSRSLLSAQNVTEDAAEVARKGYQYRSYGEIVHQLQLLEEQYPSLIELSSAQKLYGLSSPGTCKDHDGGEVPCEQWIVRLTNEHTLAEDEEERPEVFFSGCLHGDEWVGPATLIELILYMVEEYAAGTNPWITFLMDSRSIFMMPMTNSIGYQQTRRAENGLDPNRDFPYDQKPSKCMQTITARAVNEVWRNHIFQMAVTFHGGMQAIAYEWGGRNHPKPHDKSPDDLAQQQIADKMVAYAGPYKADVNHDKWYPAGRLNHVVYPVAGGMEDWGYGGSWEKKYIVPCEQKAHAQNGPYPRKKTIYNDAAIRAFNILVECSDRKKPWESELGSSKNVLLPPSSESTSGNGHVSRNMRLCLTAIDMVQPYVQWATFSWQSNVSGRSASKSSSGEGKLEVAWDVGGSVFVDETQILVGLWPKGQEPASATAKSPLQALPLSKALEAPWLSEATIVYKSQVQRGDTRWGVLQKSSATSDSQDTEWFGASERARRFLPRFRATISKSVVEKGEKRARSGGGTCCFVIVRAKVDQAWASAEALKDAHPSRTPPQSHVVNARTNAKWDKRSRPDKDKGKGRRVRGHLWWHSEPVTLPPSAGIFGLAEKFLNRGSDSIDDTSGSTGGAGGGGSVSVPAPVTPSPAFKLPSGSLKEHYLTLQEVDTFVAGAKTALASRGKQNPAVQVDYPIVIGKSYEGRDIRAACVGDCSNAAAPAALYTSAIHSKEPMGVMVVLAYLDHLVRRYTNADPAATALLQSRQLWFVPVLNPDGYEYNRRSPPPGDHGGVRKNRRPTCEGSMRGSHGSAGSTSAALRKDSGIDLNRNFGTCWGSDNEDSSDDKCSEAYRGEQPMSEPESQAVKALLEGKVRGARSYTAVRFAFAVNYHSYGKYINVPYSCKAKGLPPPKQWAVLQETARAMSRSSGFDWGQSWCQRPTPMEPGAPVNRDGCLLQSQSGLYPVAGEMSDWMFEKFGTYAMSVEVAPEWPYRSGNHNGFWPSQSAVTPACLQLLGSNEIVAWRAGAYFEVVPAVAQDGNGGVQLRVRNVGVQPSSGSRVSVRLSSSQDGATAASAGPFSIPALAARTSATQGMGPVLDIPGTIYAAVYDSDLCFISKLDATGGALKATVVQQAPASMCTSYGKSTPGSVTITSTPLAFGQREGKVGFLHDSTNR